MLKIAITGNIATGKSQVENILKDLNYAVFDTDIIAHNILNNVKEFYGLDVFTNGKIDRQKLGKLVFKDSDIKQKLENIVHPQVKSEILHIFETHKNENLVFISVPLLYETGFDKLFDKVILIITDENIQLQRLIWRNNLSEEDAIRRIKSQIPQEQKINLADFIINNNGTIDELKNEINRVLKNIS